MASREYIPSRGISPKREVDTPIVPSHSVLRRPPQHQPLPKPSEDESSMDRHQPTGTLSHTSTHGHQFREIEPMAKHSGASVTTFFNGLFQTILAISTLGASITFNYVLSNNQPSSDTPIPTPNTPNSAQTWSSCS